MARIQLSEWTPETFRYERERLGISRQKVADDIGVHRRTVENWEWGLRPIPQYAENLLKCLKLARIVKERGLGPMR